MKPPCYGRAFIARLSLSTLLVMFACTADPGFQGRTSSEWIAQLRDSSETRQVDAAFALSEVLKLNPRLPKVITALVSAMADTSDALRTTAARSLSQPDVEAVDALPGLAIMLADSAHAPVRRQAVRAIGILLANIPATSPHFATGHAHLRSALDDTAVDVRVAAVDALGSLRSRDGRTVKALNALRYDPNPSVRAAVANVLDRSGPSGNTPQHREPTVFERCNQLPPNSRGC